jgi:hypothetical protein
LGEKKPHLEREALTHESKASKPSHMTWETPQYSRSKVDRAGDILINNLRSPTDEEWALYVINNWRASHSFPLNTFQMFLRGRARQVDPSALIAQRVKRLSSIEYKLRMQPGMKLSRMQDIGGCRAVVADVPAVRELRDLYRFSHLKHPLVKEDDYISEPKRSGYRSIHRVYRYASDRSSTYNGLQIEVQMRSQLQHAWATAVETVGTFLQQSLKASQGSDDWLRFFALMGSAVARLENAQLVPDTPTSRTGLIRDLKHYIECLDVDRKLSAYARTIRTLEKPEIRGAHYFLLDLRPSEGTITVTAFPRSELPAATARYLDVERHLTGAGSEAVLVSVESLGLLRRAYPNYFLDTGVFLDTVKRAIA